MHHWIRERVPLAITHTSWHAVSGVTPAGVRIAACGEIFGPDDALDRMSLEEAPPDETRCGRCDELALRGSASALDGA